MKLRNGAHITIREYVWMGTALSFQLDFSRQSPRKSKSCIKHNRRTMEDQVSRLNNNAPDSFNDVHFVEELVPERYLVLLTERMTEMLFRLMTFNETSKTMSGNGLDHQITRRSSLDGDDISIPMVIPSSNAISDRSSSQFLPTHHSCNKCRMQMLTIEEFRELHNAFDRVDSDHDNFLSRDEIRTALNDLFELSECDIKEIISIFDTNKDDRISLEEYIGTEIFSSYKHEYIDCLDEMKHRLLHEFTREEIKRAFDQADLQHNGQLRADELKTAISYLNLHLPNQQIVESKDGRWMLSKVFHCEI